MPFAEGEETWAVLFGQLAGAKNDVIRQAYKYIVVDRPKK